MKTVALEPFTVEVECTNDELDRINRFYSNNADFEKASPSRDQRQSHWSNRPLQLFGNNALATTLLHDGAGYDLKTLRKTFRINYGNILKWVHGLGQNSIHKKVMCTAEDLRNSSADFDYTEAIDTAIANRKYLLDRLVSVSHTWSQTNSLMG